MKKKTVKEVKMREFLIWACKSQDFAQSQKKVARSHNRVTVTFRNSGRSSSKVCNDHLIDNTIFLFSLF